MVNPLDSTFEQQRIQINAFVGPIDSVVPPKTFLRCELIGPAVVMFSGCSLRGNSFTNCDFVLAREGAGAANLIRFDGATIHDCTLFKLTVVVPEGHKEGIEKGIAGVNWIT